MTIQGAIVLEDTTITFSVNPDNSLTYVVKDYLTGKQEVKTVDGKDFMVAMAIALDFNGGESFANVEELYKTAESVQPEDKELRWIP